MRSFPDVVRRAVVIAVGAVGAAILEAGRAEAGRRRIYHSPHRGAARRRAHS